MNRANWNHKQAIKFMTVLAQIASRYKHAASHKVPEGQASKELKDLRYQVGRVWSRKESLREVGGGREAFEEEFQKAKKEYETLDKKLQALEKKEAVGIVAQVREAIAEEDRKAREKFRRFNANSGNQLNEPPALAA